MFRESLEEEARFRVVLTFLLEGQSRLWRLHRRSKELVEEDGNPPDKER
jgi:hypothetical protein